MECGNQECAGLRTNTLEGLKRLDNEHAKKVARVYLLHEVWPFLPYQMAQSPHSVVVPVHNRSIRRAIRTLLSCPAKQAILFGSGELGNIGDNSDRDNLGDFMSSQAAIATAEAWQDAFNSLDTSAMADNCNFPHVRLAKGAFTRFETRQDFLDDHARMKDSLASEDLGARYNGDCERRSGGAGQSPSSHCATSRTCRRHRLRTVQHLLDCDPARWPLGHSIPIQFSKLIGRRGCKLSK